MNLQETCETFITWVKSCKTQQQLDLLNEIMDPFVFERFASHDKTELLHAGANIMIAIQEQSKVVTQPVYPKLNYN